MKKLLLLVSFVLVAALSFAQGGSFSMENVIKTPPSPAQLVNDYAGILTGEQKITLEQKLVKLDDSTFTQIVVVIVPSLGGMDVADAATELGRSWGVGNKKNNSGVVLLISRDDRKLNISPGYGLEGSLTDVEASHIIEDVIVPNFKGNDYYRGIDEGTDAIMQAVRGTYNTARERSSGGSGGSIWPFVIIVIIIISLISRGGGRNGGSFMSSRGAMPFILGNLLGSAGRGGGGGGFGGFGGGGGSSGGFGGFGGGSFGGGGSSGSW